MKILVSNVGSTSLKFKLFEMPRETVLCTGKVERVGSPDDAIFAYENLQTGYRVEQICGIPGYTEGIAAFTACMTEPDPKIGVLTDIREVDAVGFKTVAAKGFYGVHELTEEVIRGMEEFMSGHSKWSTIKHKKAKTDSLLEGDKLICRVQKR